MAVVRVPIGTVPGGLATHGSGYEARQLTCIGPTSELAQIARPRAPEVLGLWDIKYS